MSPAATFGPILDSEIDAAVQIFLEAFSENSRKIYGDPPKPYAMRDVWSFVHEIEPGGFLAARDDSSVVGYAIFTASLSRLRRRALASGRLIVWAFRALIGRYEIRWRNVAALLWNKILFVGSSNRYRTAGDAQLLNIAVSPVARGKGIATGLMRAGLAYLQQRQVAEVRLEVRPDNASAIHVYRETGFIERGRTRDNGGDWIVMTARP